MPSADERRSTPNHASTTAGRRRAGWAHLAHLVVAEHPVSEHRAYMSGEQPQRRQRQGEEDEGSGEPQPTPGATPSSRQPGSALSRATEGRETTLDDLYLLERKYEPLWPARRDLLPSTTNSSTMQGGPEHSWRRKRHLVLLQDKHVSRNHPLYALYRRQTRRPYRKGYAAALLRRINEALDRELYRSSAVQRARDRAQIALMRLFDFMTPNKLNHHVSWAIGLYLLILSVTFMAMAGGFQLQRAGGPDADAFPDWGPAELKRYVQGKDAYKFDEPYLVEWGAVTSEKAGSADQFWRWLTSPLLYNSFPRFAADVLLMLLLGGLLEYKYGGGWLAFFLVVCALGSTFFAAALAPSCDITFSSSGVVPALLLLYSLDVGFGWTVPHLGLLHAAFVFTLLLLWVALRTAFGWPPARTVAGGLLVGAVVGPAMLPSLRWQKLEEAASATLLAGVLGIFFVALPVAQSVLTSAGSCS